MRTLRVIVIAASMTVLLPGLAYGTTNGEVDSGNEYPFVDLLAFYDSEGE